MQRDKYLAYLAEFDELMSQLENPQIARTMENAASHGMRVEEIAFFYSVSVDSIQNDLDILERIQILTQNVSKEI